jgi:hypothetical protein
MSRFVYFFVLQYIHSTCILKKAYSAVVSYVFCFWLYKRKETLYYKTITIYSNNISLNFSRYQGTMSKNDDDGNLEYYKAKQDVGHMPVSKQETKKISKSSSSKNDTLRSKSDGYVAMNESPGKNREFERYKEITFAQKASDRAKQNPLIP